MLEFADAKSGEDAWQLGQIIGVGRTPHKQSLEIMESVVWKKFTQNRTRMAALKATGKKYLVEYSKDNWWGDGKDGKGANHLGKILMKIRGGGTSSKYYSRTCRDIFRVPAKAPVSTMCQVCNKYPVFVGPNGPSPCCSRTCLALLGKKFTTGVRVAPVLKVRKITAHPIAPKPLCRMCHKKQCYEDAHSRSQFCSLTCMAMFEASTRLSPSRSTPPGSSLVKMCIMCNKKPIFIDSMGKASKCCSQFCLKQMRGY